MHDETPAASSDGDSDGSAPGDASDGNSDGKLAMEEQVQTELRVWGLTLHVGEVAVDI